MTVMDHDEFTDGQAAEIESLILLNQQQSAHTIAKSPAQLRSLLFRTIQVTVNKEKKDIGTNQHEKPSKVCSQ